MRIIVFDTNILIDYANGYADWLDDILDLRNRFNLVLPTIVIAEYFTSQALENKKEVDSAEETFALFAKQDLTEDIAHELGKILRRKTYVSGTELADLIIAATTVYLDAELATRNKKDFAKIPDLRFFNPSRF